MIKLGLKNNPDSPWKTFLAFIQPRTTIAPKTDLSLFLFGVSAMKPELDP